MKTVFPSLPSIERDWHVIDADGAVLGRLASQAAFILMGKNKPRYTPFMDTGDHVIVVNAAKVRMTGRKEDQKLYRRHSGYPGGISSTNFEKLQDKYPDRVLKHAVKGMLPKGPLGYAMIKKLKVYGGAEHPHTAQQPKVLEIAGISTNAVKRESAK